jgi:hypothetical protein
MNEGRPPFQPTASIPDLTELGKAAMRLGETPSSFMRWVLKFIQQDLSSFSIGDWLNLGHEVLLFSLLGKPVAEDPSKIIPRLGISIPEMPTHETIVDLQLKTRSHIENILSKEETTFTESGPVTQKIIILRKAGPVGARVAKAVGRKPLTRDCAYRIPLDRLPWEAFKHALADLLLETGFNLRQCPECRTIFLTDRRNKQFCTPRCVSRGTTRRYLDKQRKSKLKSGRARKAKKIQQRKSTHTPTRRGSHGTKKRTR